MLFLDDDPARHSKFQSRCPYATRVETSAATIKQLSENEFDIVFLDHDLGGEIFVDSDREDTGMEVVRWLQSNHCTIELIVIHSLNDGAVTNMVTRLRQSGYRVLAFPFTSFDSADVYSQLGL